MAPQAHTALLEKRNTGKMKNMIINCRDEDQNQTYFDPFGAKWLNIFKMIWYYTADTPQGTLEINMYCMASLKTFCSPTVSVCGLSTKINQNCKYKSKVAVMYLLNCGLKCIYCGTEATICKNRHSCHSPKRKWKLMLWQRRLHEI